MDDDGKIKASAGAGLSKAETEGILNRKMTPEERRLFDGVKAVQKLRKAKTAEGPAAPALPEGRMPSLKERYTKAEVEDSIRRCDGRWAAVVRDLNCSYDQLGVWMEHHPQHRKLADQLREAAVHEAEDQVWQLLHSPSAAVRADMAKFVLKTLGRRRGWGEGAAQEITVKDGEVEIKQIFGI